MRTLLIDDVRERAGVSAIARTAEMAKAILSCPHHFDMVFLDHDLGGKETGNDILKWMFERYIHPSSIVLVTMNPIGRQNMENTLKDNSYVFARGAWQDNLGGRWDQKVYEDENCGS